LRVYARIFPGDLETAADAIDAVRSGGRAGSARGWGLRKVSRRLRLLTCGNATGSVAVAIPQP
jgi:hypothetical protein